MSVVSVPGSVYAAPPRTVAHTRSLSEDWPHLGAPEITEAQLP